MWRRGAGWEPRCFPDIFLFFNPRERLAEPDPSTNLLFLNMFPPEAQSPQRRASCIPPVLYRKGLAVSRLLVVAGEWRHVLITRTV